MSDPSSPRHIPVLVDDVVQALSPLAGKTIVDGTLGLGGHAQALLEADASVRLLGIDRDRQALSLAGQRLAAYADRLSLIHGNFRELAHHLDRLEIRYVDGVLLDIGVSSLHLDESTRGFSFRRDGPLDMRMDRSMGQTAAEWLSEVSESALVDVIYRLGEERYARRIAGAIIRARAVEPLLTTGQLAEIIRRAVPAKYDYRRLDPATRTFQAIRMHLNDELGALETALSEGFARLCSGGRLVVISFHSLEDRLVKHFFREKAKACICPPDFPDCICDKQIEARVLTPRPRTASAEEVDANPRARSAKLRAAERLV